LNTARPAVLDALAALKNLLYPPHLFISSSSNPTLTARTHAVHSTVTTLTCGVETGKSCTQPKPLVQQGTTICSIQLHHLSTTGLATLGLIDIISP
jgi:hypothetical protein